MRLRLTNFVVLAFIWLGLTEGQASAALPGKANLLFLRAGNATGDTNQDFRIELLDLLIAEHFRQLTNLCLLPASTLAYAEKTVIDDNRKPLLPEKMRELAIFSDAQFAVSANFTRSNGGWSLEATIVPALTNAETRSIHIDFTNWWSGSFALSRQIATYLSGAGLSLNLSNSTDFLSRSDEALEHYARAEDEMNQNNFNWTSRAEVHLRKALEKDPTFIKARWALGSLYQAQERIEEATTLITSLNSKVPDFPLAHYTMAQIFLRRGKGELARAEFRRALTLDPGDVDSCAALAELSLDSRKLEAAAEYARRGVELEPYGASTHAALARVYVESGDRDKALQELNLAECYATTNDCVIESMLADRYERLRIFPKAIKNLELAIKSLNFQGFPAVVLSELETKRANLRRHLETHFLDAVEPTQYSNDQLANALKKRLQASEFNSVTNPFASNERIRAFARQAAAGSSHPIDQAKALFAAMLRHSTIKPDVHSGRTADQVMRDWEKPDVFVTCADYTHLYVALARELGLHAYCAIIQKDYSGAEVAHACSAIFVNGKVLLIDPAYDWFGVPHISYSIEDDLHAIGLYLGDSPDLSMVKLAVKIIPDSADVWFQLSNRCSMGGELNNAKRYLAQGLRLNDQSWRSWECRANVDIVERDYKLLVEHAEKWLQLRPDSEYAQYALAGGLAAENKVAEARRLLQRCLATTDDARLKKSALDLLLSLDGAKEPR